MTGEILYYKIYFLNQDPVPSGIVHVNLVDSAGNVHMHQILPVLNNTARGQYRIPYDFKEANYRFLCYTRWNLDFGKRYIFNKLISVYNEFEGNVSWDPESEHTYLDEDSINHVIQQADGRLKLQISNPGPIHARDSVCIKITSDNQYKPLRSAELSVSVMDFNMIGLSSLENILYSSVPIKDTPEINGSGNYLPEDSIYIKGTAFDPVSGDPVTSRVFSIYNVNEGTFSRLRCVDGNYSFNLPVFKGRTDLQIINMNPFQPKVPNIQILPVSNELPHLPVFNPEPERSPEVEKYLYYSILRRKINEIFFEFNPDSIRLEEPAVLPFKPDRSFDMSKYRLIKNVFDFIHEAAFNTTFYKENGTQKFRLFNIQTKKYFMTPPWFVVDGHFIFNDSLVYNIPFSHLKRIDLYVRNSSIFRYFEPIMVQGGVVAIYTKDNYLIDYIRKMPNTVRVNGFPTSNFQDETEKSGPDGNHATPDLSPVIYWNPEIHTNDQGFAEVVFRANDVTGLYLMHVAGMTENGDPLSGNLIIRIIP